METFAIVSVKGKQYLAEKGEHLFIDRYAAKEGAAVTFKDVLLSASGSKIEIGTPFVKNATVEVKVIAHVRGPKGHSFRYRPKKRVRRLRGYRADLTELEVTKIS